MEESLTVTSKVRGPVTLKAAKKNNNYLIEVWYQNEVIAEFELNYIWDFLDFMMKIPDNTEYPGLIRRRNQMFAANLLANDVAILKTLKEVADLLQPILSYKVNFNAAEHK